VESDRDRLLDGELARPAIGDDLVEAERASSTETGIRRRVASP
jgi:hypothetical protein